MERGLSNKFINKFLYQTVNTYSGCWSVNNVPYDIVVQQEYFSLIVNTAKKGQKGEHFISVMVSPSSIRIYDSQGLFSYPKTLALNLKKYLPGRRLIHTPMEPVQAATSVFCGFYVIYSVLIFDRHIKQCVQKENRGCTVNLRLNRPFNKINLRSNDDKVVNEIIKIIKSIK